MRILQKRNRMGWSQNRPARDTTFTRQIGRNKKDQLTKKRKRTKIIPGSNPILVKIHRKPINKYGHTTKLIEKAKRVDLDRRTHKSL